MKLAITGASGLVGANVAEQALARGHEVVCLRRGASRVDHLAHLTITWREADLGDEDALARAFEGAEIVVHAAAAVEAGNAVTEAMRETNVGGTKRVMAACRRAKVRRLVHVSSVAAIGVSDGTRDVTEDDPFNFAEHGLLDGYTETKRAAQDAVVSAARAGEIDAVVVCPTYMFGPYDQKPSSGAIVVALAKGEIPSGTDGRQNIVDVRDVARGILLAAEKGRSGETYILGAENVTYREMFARIARIGGYRAPRLNVPRWVAAPIGWMGDLRKALGGQSLVSSMTLRWAYERGYRFSHAKATRELGYVPGPPDDGIRDCITWMRGRGMIP
jgi:dihydroflavonol-4-reductase